MAYTQFILDVQDVLYDVFPYLDPEHYASRGEIARVRQTLFRSAITCKNFTRPALKILWKHIPSDEPLLLLLSLYDIVCAQKGTLSEAFVRCLTILPTF
ncbi:hypothetical protein C8Q80DRAFT_946020 [Daedaleopsis nitida]|nr:hypothetical protein C8Q80DRAFT_946020 [Daedaleopsis nitida]